MHGIPAQQSLRFPRKMVGYKTACFPQTPAWMTRIFPTNKILDIGYSSKTLCTQPSTNPKKQYTKLCITFLTEYKYTEH